MKKTILFMLAAAMVFSTAAAKDKKKKDALPTPVEAPKVFNNEVDTMSYALGMNVGKDFSNSLKQIPGGKTNIELIIKGFTASMKGDSTLIKQEVAMNFLRAYFTKAQAVEVAKKKDDAKQFMANNMTKEGVKTTSSGLQYVVMKDATGVKPKETDSVTVNYIGTLTDGKKFDSSYDHGQPVTFPLNGVIKGWTEGIQLMSVGSKYKFFIPYELAYGEQGGGQVIPPYANLIFEVELLAVKPVVAPAPVAEPAKAAPAKKASAKKATPAKKK